MNYKACLLIPYFGNRLPAYFSLFLQSCYVNINFKFIFFTDLTPPVDLPSNVIVEFMTIETLKALINEKLGVNVEINNGYKLIDFKPAYGKIFEDYVGNVPFWGNCDIDLIFGKIENVITSDYFDNYDIISVKQHWFSGSFGLYRNTERIKKLYALSKDYQKVFNSPETFVFDELGQLKVPSSTSIYEEIIKVGGLRNLDVKIESLTHILLDKDKTKGLRVHFGDLIKECLAEDEVVVIDQGEVKAYRYEDINDDSKGVEAFAYHFVGEKYKLTFHYPNWENVPRKYYISNEGFFTEKEFRYFRVLKKYRTFNRIKIYKLRNYIWKFRTGQLKLKILSF